MIARSFNPFWSRCAIQNLMARESIIMELVDSLAEMHKKELAIISEVYKHELAIKDAYVKGFKKEILKQLATVTTKVIELQKKLDAMGPE